jgi:serine phosphatase RsbU (regulator of sigma subunit)
MEGDKNHHSRPLLSALSRRILRYIFISVILIEAIILVPSYLQRKDELLANLREKSAAQIEVVLALAPPNTPAPELLEMFAGLAGCPGIVGGALYRGSGEPVGIFGEPPEFSFESVRATGLPNVPGTNPNRYDSAWTQDQLNRDFVVVLRQDITAVRNNLQAFVLRIAGLVILISVFVTAGAWVALEPIVVRPILRLRRHLLQVGKAIRNDRPKPSFDSAAANRRDELGEVITAFNRMVRQVTEAIDDRKNAENALQKSLHQVESFSLQLNMELERGREIQQNFLPAVLPERPGWEFDAFFRPARQVAGDFYDVFNLPNNCVGLVIADVCDKGVGAALFMALFRSLIRIFSGQTALQGLECRTNASETEIAKETGGNGDSGAAAATVLNTLQLTNDYIFTNHEDLAMFATLFFGVLQPQSGELVYVNGGHDAPIIAAPGGTIRCRLDPTGPAVGIQAGVRFEVGRVVLAPGELFYAYTDGIVEARSTNGSFFGENRLTAVLEAKVESSHDLLASVNRAVKTHIGSAEPFDDMTMLAARRQA